MLRNVALGRRLIEIDRRIMLRWPRVWLTRVHAVLFAGVIAYALLGVFAQFVLRPLLVSQLAELSQGSGYYGYRSATMTEPLTSGLMLTAAMAQARVAVQVRLTLACFVVAVIGGFLSILWLRAQSRFGIEAVFGRRMRAGAWLEWGCYAVGAATFAAVALWTFLALSPSAPQRNQAQAVDAQTRQAVRTLAEARGLTPGTFIGADQTINWRAVLRQFADIDLGPIDELSIYQPEIVRLVPPPELGLRTVFSPGTGGGDWAFATPLSAPGQRYLESVADKVYVDAHAALIGTISLVQLYARLFVWWFIGVEVFVLYAAKRARLAHVLVAALAAFVVLPFGTLIALAGAQLVTSALRINLFSGPDSDLWLWLAMVLPYLGVLAVAALLAFRAFITPAFARRTALAVLFLPLLIGYLPLLLAIGAFTQPVLRGVGDAYGMERFGDVIIPALAVIPFCYVPFLPVLDRALLRLYALPHKD